MITYVLENSDLESIGRVFGVRFQKSKFSTTTKKYLKYKKASKNGGPTITKWTLQLPREFLIPIPTRLKMGSL